MRHRLTARRSRLRARVQYLWNDTDPAPIELLTTALSLALGLVLLWPDSVQHPSVPRPPWTWGLIVLAAGFLKLVGVINEWRWGRMVGLIAGAGFWCAFALIYGVPANTPIWVTYVILMLAQIWALRRVVRP